MGDRDYSCKKSGLPYCVLQEMYSSKKVEAMLSDGTMEKKCILDRAVMEDVTDGCNIPCERREIAMRLCRAEDIEQIKIVSDLAYFLGEKDVSLLTLMGRLIIGKGLV